MMYGWFDGNMGVVGWIVMTIVMVLFWGGLAVLLVQLLRRRPTTHGELPVRPAHHDAEQVLNERFARGEIDEKEFGARRAALRRD